MTKQIPLSRGLFTLVDDDDFEFLNQWKWYATPHGNTYYAGHDEQHKNILMHRVIMNPPHGMEPDHRNGNGLDNRRENLRLGTHAQNSCNRRKNKNNKSGFKGVAQIGKSYQARITIGGKCIHIGMFTDPIEAARAYDKAAKEHHGEFAVTNF